jgi:hypothetical protein
VIAPVAVPGLSSFDLLVFIAALPVYTDHRSSIVIGHFFIMRGALVKRKNTQRNLRVVNQSS